MTPITERDLRQLFQLSIDMLSIIRINGTFKCVSPSSVATRAVIVDVEACLTKPLDVQQVPNG